MMRPIVAASLAILVVVGCLVHRPSSEFACETTTDCSAGRTCDNGYCVVDPACPPGCTTCDAGAMTCSFDCTSANSCGAVECPSGWTCSISCVGSGACTSIDCLSSSRCQVTCTDLGACETLTCGNACQCDLTCSEAGACAPPSCPHIGAGANREECTSDGQLGSPCDSAHAAGCTKC